MIERYRIVKKVFPRGTYYIIQERIGGRWFGSWLTLGHGSYSTLEAAEKKVGSLVPPYEETVGWYDRNGKRIYSDF